MSKAKQNQVTTSIIHDENTKVTVTTEQKKPRRWRGNMLMVGVGKGGSFAYEKALISLSKPASLFFLDYVRENADRKTNLVNITPALTGLPPDVLSRSNREIINSGLMLKVKNGLYMLNPRAIFVAEEYADAADEMWNTIKLKRMTKESR